MAQAAVLVPVGLWGLSHGLTAPDLDISLLGIGKHRFFLFHSALGLVALRYFYNKCRVAFRPTRRFTPFWGKGGRIYIGNLCHGGRSSPYD